jgi:hypothetical protein
MTFFKFLKKRGISGLIVVKDGIDDEKNRCATATIKTRSAQA